MSAQATAHRLESAVCSIIKGQQNVIRRVLACMISGGHVLLEDYPGTGKTTLAKAIAKAIDGTVFKRVQFTPDLLPSDILGISVLDPKARSSASIPVPSSRTSCSRMKSTGRPRGRRAPCWKRWANGRPPSKVNAMIWKACFS